MVQAGPVHVFYSYSHRDSAYRDELATHLALMRRRGLITEWHDRQIDAGREWSREIEEALRRADIVLLLVSADFIASDYCFGIEMKEALERQRRRQTEVIPVIIRPVDWQDAPFAHLQALPPDGRPVTSWNMRDEAWTLVAKAIRQTVENLRGRVRVKAAALVGSDDHREIKRAIEAFGGRIRAAASARSLKIPPDAGQVPGAELANLAAPKRILWVDDNPANNELEMGALFALQVEIETATSTEDALASMGEQEPDLVITDWNRTPQRFAGMPEGLRLLMELRGRHPTVPTIGTMAHSPGRRLSPVTVWLWNTAPSAQRRTRTFCSAGARASLHPLNSCLSPQRYPSLRGRYQGIRSRNRSMSCVQVPCGSRRRCEVGRHARVGLVPEGRSRVLRRRPLRPHDPRARGQIRARSSACSSPVHLGWRSADCSAC